MHPTAVCLPGKSHGQRSLMLCSPWGHKEPDRAECTHTHTHTHTHLATESRSLSPQVLAWGKQDRGYLDFGFVAVDSTSRCHIV